ncbi:hypothetical protein ACF5W4_09950 [Bacillota bacterium Lsc_1132]
MEKKPYVTAPVVPTQPIVTAPLMPAQPVPAAPMMPAQPMVMPTAPTCPSYMPQYGYEQSCCYPMPMFDPCCVPMLNPGCGPVFDPCCCPPAFDPCCVPMQPYPYYGAPY